MDVALTRFFRRGLLVQNKQVLPGRAQLGQPWWCARASGPEPSYRGSSSLVVRSVLTQWVAILLHRHTYCNHGLRVVSMHPTTTPILR
jgi:hypothetical protein